MYVVEFYRAVIYGACWGVVCYTGDYSGVFCGPVILARLFCCVAVVAGKVIQVPAYFFFPGQVYFYAVADLIDSVAQRVYGDQQKGYCYGVAGLFIFFDFVEQCFGVVA